MSRKAVLFLVLTFALSWAAGFAALSWIGDFASLNETGSGLGTIMLFFVGYMYIPTLVVIVVEKGIYRESLKPLGISFNFSRWWIFAALVPIVIAVLSIGVSALEPGVSLSSGRPFLMDQLENASLPQDQLEQARRSISQEEMLLGPILALVLFGFALVAGPTVNAIAAFGEEFGWHGLLQKESYTAEDLIKTNITNHSTLLESYFHIAQELSTNRRVGFRN